MGSFVLPQSGTEPQRTEQLDGGLLQNGQDSEEYFSYTLLCGNYISTCACRGHSDHRNVMDLDLNLGSTPGLLYGWSLISLCIILYIYLLFGY